MTETYQRYRNRFQAGLDDSQVLYEKDPSTGIARMTLNRPEKLNALSTPMRERIRLLCLEASDDDEVKVILLSGNGRAFCSGDELMEDWGQRNDWEERGRRRFGITDWNFRYLDEITSGRDAFVQIMSRCTKPIVAQVHTYCIGAAFFLFSINCDIILVAEGTELGRPRLGSASGGALGGFESVKMARSWGLKAYRWSFSSIPHTAEEAVRTGFAYKAVPADQLAQAGNELALQIARLPLSQVRLMKQRFKSVEVNIGCQYGADEVLGAPLSSAAPAGEFSFYREAGKHGLREALQEASRRLDLSVAGAKE